ncbi:MAG: endonuclease domain-containing protein [Parasphingopyxis sp.]|uniref:endonuclease domain-containing protein n=1 Tax=Parasphingopyxis sp. TaxID=1920299 RepID=UPI0032EC384E
MITGPRDTVKRARQLRSEMSLPETRLWRALRQRPGGFKFRRQHPAGEYVLDFYCAAVKLAIEVDGMAHDGEAAVKRDEARSRSLRSQHVATLRVPAKVILDDLEVVVSRIVEVCSDRAEKMKVRQKGYAPLHHPADGPPPRAGEDLA